MTRSTPFLLGTAFVFAAIVSFLVETPAPALAHGIIDQQQTAFIPGATTCGVNPPFGQSFTPTANNIVAFDVNITAGPQTANFTIRQAPFTTDLIPPFPVSLVSGINHIDIPGAPLPLTPGAKYGWLTFSDCATGLGFGISPTDVYAGGALLAVPLFTPGVPPVESPVDGDLYFKTYSRHPRRRTSANLSRARPFS